MKFLYLIFLICTTSWAISQKYNFINYTVESGLAQSQINDISQDALGYLWVATESGLSRFDGTNFVNFSMDNGLPDNEIEKLYLDEDHILWVGTPKGIAFFDGQEFVPYYFEEQERIYDLNTLKGKLYLATENGLLEFADKKFNKISSNTDQNLNIRSILNYKDSILICGTNTGIFTWNKGYGVLADSSLLTVNVSGIELQNESLIIATYGSGLLNYSLSNNVLINYGLELYRIRSIYADEEVILCSTLNGAIEVKDGEATYFTEKNGLINERLRCTFRDTENNYWLGTDGNGILKFSGKSIISYSPFDGLSSNLIMSIAQDKDSNFYLGTYDEGITIIKNDLSISYLNDRNGLQNNSVWANYKDSQGRIWATTSKGINCIENGKIINKTITNKITSKIRCVIEHNNAIFFGGVEGVFVLEKDSIRRLSSTIHLNVNDICAIGADFFIAGKTGLYTISSADNYESLTKVIKNEESVNSLVSDRNGNIWIGTNNGLKIRFPNGAVFPVLLDKDDFKAKMIFGLLEAKNGNIWVTTMNGVYQLQPSSKKGKKYAINHYANAEGLINLESNQNSVYEDYEGNIWVGTSNGLAKINPELNNELFDFKAPKLHITGIRLFMEEFDYDRFDVTYAQDQLRPQTIGLPYNQNHLTFDFIGLNLKDPESVVYEYRLVGATESWSPLNKSNSATYSSISPGDYTFEVRATNKSFSWSKTEQIYITIYPPFWKRWWFIAAVTIAIGFIIVMLFQIRIRSIRQKEENEKLGYRNRLLFLEQQSLNASMNRHFIFNSLNSIQYFINSSDKLSANKYLTSFAKLIRKNLDSSTANNFIVTLQEEIDRIELYLTLEKMRFQEKFDYKLIIDSSLDTETTEIPSMILQPFVENAIIHGVLPLNRKGQIDIKIYEEFGEIIFEVIDDGVGIENSLANKKVTINGDHQSKGMEITNRRIELLRKLTGDNLMIIGPFQLNDDKGLGIGTKVVIKMGLIKEN